MTRRKKILLTIGAGLAGLLSVLLLAVVVVVQTPWFANFARQKIIAVAAESTGGVAEIGSFQFDLAHLTIRIRNFALHGTEPPGSDPLLRVELLEVRLKLFAGLRKALDLRYLGIEQPRLNLLLLPDGRTNIPQPKTPKKPSQTSGLETVVDLAVGKFQLNDGLVKVLQQKTAFSGRGENLRVLLNYNTVNPSYSGNLSIDPLVITSGTRPPLNLHVNVPVTLERDAVKVNEATLNTAQSRATFSGSMQNMNAPVLTARLNANISLPEIQKSIDMPLNTSAKGSPSEFKLELAMSMNQTTNAIQLQTAHLGLGRTTFQAAGEMSPNRQGAIRFNSDFALAELATLFDLSSVRTTGALQANGRATLDARDNYAIDGTLNSHDLTIGSGNTQISGMSLYSPFHVDPFLISMDGLKLNALGGSLAAKIFLEQLRNLSVEGRLRSFSLPVLAATFTGKHLDYDGTVDGSVVARGDVKAKGTTGYMAEANLSIAPGYRGLPVSGRLRGKYAGARGTLDLDPSYVALPNSRLDLRGSLNQRIDIKLISRNLTDFLPVVNFGSSNRHASLPIALQGGTALLDAQITGNTAAPHIGGHMEISDFAAAHHPFDRFALDVNASPSGASVQNGLLAGRGLNTNFDVSIGLVKWKPLPSSPLSANLALRNADLADLASLAGPSPIQAAGAATADVHISGSYGNPLGAAAFEVINGSVYNQPFSKFSTNVNLADQLISLSQLELDTAGGKITANGTFRHPRESFTTGRAEIQLASDNVQLAGVQALAKQNAGIDGLIQLTANAAADVGKENQQTKIVIANVTADLSARNLRVQNQDAGNLTATARTTGGNVNYNVSSNFAGSAIKVQGRTALAKWYSTVADLSIQNLSVAKALQIAGQGAVPARGELSANAHVDGGLDAPNAELNFALVQANVYQESINSFKGRVRYTEKLVEIPSIQLDTPAGSLTLTGSLAHPTGSFKSGSLNLKLHSSEIQMARIEHVQQAKPGLDGIVRLAADLSGNLREQQGKTVLLLSHLNADASAAALHLNEMNMGGMNFTARTSGPNLNFRLDSDVAQSRIHGTGQAQLAGDYPLRANLSFSNIRYSNVAPFIVKQTPGRRELEALVEGQVSVNGPILKPDGLVGRLQLDRVDFRTNPSASPTGAPALRIIELQNQGPIVIGLDHAVVRVEQLHVLGRDTSLNASGSISLKNTAEPLALNVDANADLGLLQDADRDFYSSGSVTMNAVIRGSFSQPRANGRVELRNASVNYANAPNGLSNANGVIVLNGTTATIDSLTAESGGGKIEVGGFVGLGASVPTFNLRATATKVRVRYSGVSATSNAVVNLTGNLKRSLLAGTVTVQKIAYAKSSDAGSLLSVASTPPSTPSAPSPLLSGMRLDIHVLTAPDLQVVSSYANRLSMLANLTVRGTAENPGMLGRMTIMDGQLVFFGNTYTVTTGTINFYDPTAISPILNVSLETIAQGVTVTIGVTGAMNDLKLSYRSDPPLSFEQIVQLLATNTTPANPVIAAHQPVPQQQSLSQMGESAVLSQAVANPLASRVQRVFGLSQFKIDPSISSTAGPSARVTLQEKITSNITFTYITDTSQTNAQIVRVQMDVTTNLSAVALRDYNGNVSIEFFYKFTRR